MSYNYARVTHARYSDHTHIDRSLIEPIDAVDRNHHLHTQRELIISRKSPVALTGIDVTAPNSRISVA
jgi:hypothetical protein